VAVAPALLILLLILAYPIVDSMLLSLQELRAAGGTFEGRFIGLSNYGALLADRTFRAALWATAYFTAIEVLVVVLLALGVALLLVHPFGRFGIFRIVLLLPWAIAPVANAVLWKWILHANYGILNTLLTELGLIERNVIWLGTPGLALHVLAVMSESRCRSSILLLAASARCRPCSIGQRGSGCANAWQQFRHITLPQLRPTIAVAVILQTLWSLRIFDLIFVLTKGGPADGTVLLNFLAYRTTFNFLDLGYGAAIANVIFAVSFVLALGYIWLLRPGLQKSGG
jgi:ABC-type sugar transport system permease subunit